MSQRADSSERRVASGWSALLRAKLLAAAIVLLIAGLAPAAAIIGFCTRMPCCNHASAMAMAIATGRGDCCTTITCHDSPSAQPATTAARVAPPATPAAVVSAPPRAVLAAPRAIDASPPRNVADRLAVLSILLI